MASHEVSAFRAYAYRTFHLDFLACPPARTAFLQRGNDVGLRPYGTHRERQRRRPASVIGGRSRAENTCAHPLRVACGRRRSIVNLRELVTLMRQKGFVDVITTTTTGANSTDQQVAAQPSLTHHPSRR